MKARRRLATRWLLPVALGLSDGILNALILASAAVLRGRGSVTLALAGRVAIVALVTAAFTVFVAEYGQLRAELARAEHELNLTTAGRLATSHLGRAVLIEATQAAAAASICSFLGSLVPLLLGAALPSLPWMALLLGILALGGLGFLLARAVHGHLLRWAVAMTIGGLLVTIIGTQLDIA